MIKIAESLRGLPSRSVHFIEVPNATYPLNINWVQWTSQASALFTAIEHDRTLPRTGRRKISGTVPTLATTPPLPANVEVLNGSGVAGMASRAAASLTAQGFHVVGTTDAARYGYTSSVVEYRSRGDLQVARTLQAKVSGAVLAKVPGLTTGTLDLIVGSSFTGLLRHPKHKRHSAPVNPTGTYGGIAGNANVCHDSRAFAGPNGGF
jgi:LytR cell envelope-related transcriptional attenuator